MLSFAEAYTAGEHCRMFYIDAAWCLLVVVTLQVANLEKTLQHKDCEIQWRDAELKRLRSTIDVKVREYCDLMNAKAKVESQISAYHKVLQTR